jgi:glutamate dehydrogenase (NAD(P)+)
VNTNSRTMAWIVDAYAATLPPGQRHAALGVVTGKPVSAGGSPGREKATGQGVADLVVRWAEDNGVDLRGMTFIVQGFGNVGGWASRILQGLGARLLAVEDVTGCIRAPDGIDAEALGAHVREHGGVRGFAGAEGVTRGEFLRTPADVFIPAALENQITGETAHLLQVRLVAEGANGPTTAEGDEVLQARGIQVLPDVLCNAGGVIVSYFEWLQNRSRATWDVREVDFRLRETIVRAYSLVKAVANQRRLDWRTAAYVVALSRIEQVYQERGVFP